MRLYITVAALTFFGSFAAYSASQMSAVVPAIGGRSSGSSAGFLEQFKTYNPVTLLYGGRLRDMLNSNAGAPRIRMEGVRWRFEGMRALRLPRGSTGGVTVHRSFIAPRVPQVHFHR